MSSRLGERSLVVSDPELVWLPPDLLVPNTWNPNKMDAFMYGKAVESIKKFGFIDPITARPKDRKFEIIDGEHRWQVATDLGIKLVPTFVVPLGDADAKQLTVLLNELRGTADPVSLGALLKDLLSTESVTDLSMTLPFTDEAISAMAGMTAIDWAAVDGPTTPDVSRETKEKWVERTYRMPASVALVLDEAIEKAKDGDDIEAWQALERISAEYLSS